MEHETRNLQALKGKHETIEKRELLKKLQSVLFNNLQRYCFLCNSIDKRLLSLYSG